MAALVMAGFLLAHGLTAALVLHQAAFTAAPGDRLVVLFPPGTPATTAVSTLGASGASVVGKPGWLPVYQAEVIHHSAPERIEGGAWVMRFPGKPALKSCFGGGAEPGLRAYGERP
ncbi:MAG: hypothetical protein JJU06_01495 [Ectothiorhodospiraceae bacterium]|nr:hypothetical protein [Ectothiorhodospiraceae bacterium]